MTESTKDQAPHGELPKIKEFKRNGWVFNKKVGIGRVIELYPQITVKFLSRPNDAWFFNHNGENVDEFIHSGDYDIIPISPPMHCNPQTDDTPEIQRIKQLLSNSDLRGLSVNTLFAMLVDAMEDRERWVNRVTNNT